MLDLGVLRCSLHYIPYMSNIPMLPFKVELFNLIYINFLNCSGKAIHLLAYYVEVIHTGEVSSGDVLVMYW